MCALLLGEQDQLKLLKQILDHIQDEGATISAESLAEWEIDVSAETAQTLVDICETYLAAPGVRTELVEREMDGHPALKISEDDSVWLDCLAPIISTWMNEVGYEGAFSFQYAVVPEVPDFDSHGGGAMRIDRDGAKGLTSGQASWVLEKEAEAKAEAKQENEPAS